MAKNPYSIELQERQHQYLEEMVAKYALSDVSKAIRCLVDFAISDSENQSKIFEEIRCNDC